MSKVKITDIKPTKQGRFSIFTDGEYALSIDDETLVSNKVKIGKIVDIEELIQINYESQFRKAKRKAFDILSYREHSHHELVEKLTKVYDEEISESVVLKLEDLGLVDDDRFCRMYIRELIRKGKSSQKTLLYQLKQKGLDPYLIEDCLMDFEIDDSITVKNLVLKKFSRKLGDENQLNKVKNSLMRLGFSWGDVKSGLDLAIEELEELLWK